MSLSLVVNHTPWVLERRAALSAMMQKLGAARPTLINDTDYRGQNWQAAKVDWALKQWRWSAKQNATHHVFMTDDLHLAPHFWHILGAMIEAHSESPIGLLSNHPRGPSLFAQGRHGYRTNSWLVGPAYVLPHAQLVEFLAWFEALPDGNAQGAKGWANDDSSINEWISTKGPGQTWHPLPTIVEHRADLPSTVGHGDIYSLERISWREERTVVQTGKSWMWHSTPVLGIRLEDLAQADYWIGEAPMLTVHGAEEKT